MGLVDGDFNLRNEDKTLAVPLIRGLQTMESELLQRELGAILGEDEFEPRKKSPRTLEDALSGKISLEALKGLPRSFDIVWAISILALAPELDRYEKTVAQAILEVHPNVKALFATTGPDSGPELARPVTHDAWK